MLIKSGASPQMQTTDEVEALRTYNTTGAILIAGPKITASDPPSPAAETQAKINWHTALGIPSSRIAWFVVGESIT